MQNAVAASEADWSGSGRLQPALLGGLVVVYFLAGKLGLHFAFVHASASAVWPPTGIALAAVLLLGRRIWPPIFVGAFLVNLTTSGSIVSSLGIAKRSACSWRSPGTTFTALPPVPKESRWPRA